MKPAVFIVTVIISLLLTSCRKKPLFDGVHCSANCYILTGKFLDSVTNTGVRNAEIKFYYTERGWWGRDYLGKTTTDANGNYHFTFDGSGFAGNNGWFYAEVHKDNMFAGIIDGNKLGSFNLDTSQYNVPVVRNYPLFRNATLKINVNASTTTNFQYLNVRYGFAGPTKGIVYNGGNPINTTITWQTAGDLRTFVEAHAIGNGVNIMIRDTIIVPANETRTVEIKL